MAKHKKDAETKAPVKPAAKVGTQHAAVQDDDVDNMSVASISLDPDGMPSREVLLQGRSSFKHWGTRV